MGLSKIDLVRAANKFADTERRMGIWDVWAKYDVANQKDGGRYVLAVEPDESELPPRVDLDKALEKTGGVVHPGSHEEELMIRAAERTRLRKEGWPYWPLVDKPDLFLKFARLADDGGLDDAVPVYGLDTDKNAEVARDWAWEHGTLGQTLGREVDGFQGVSTRGGKADTVSNFAEEAWRANGCLRLYEAATADELDTDFIASYMNPRWKTFFTRTPAITHEWALNAVAAETQHKVAGNVYPALYGEVGSFVSGWAFRNLLGAMWLQMFWLLTASEAPWRCRNPQCDKIIAYEQPEKPLEHKKGERKNPNTYRNKGYCNKTCSNRHYYLTTTKPRRRAARGL